MMGTARAYATSPPINESPPPRGHWLPSSENCELAKTANTADIAQTANTVKSGAINKSMLGQDVLSDLNRTVTPQMLQPSSITTAQLNEQILKYLKPEITLAPQAPGLIFNGQTITLHSRAEGSI